MSALSDAIERVCALLFQRREERELDEELRFHLDMEAERLRRDGAAESAVHRESAA